MKIALFPYGGEKKFRQQMMRSVVVHPNEKILDLCCGTGGATSVLREKSDNTVEIVGMDYRADRIEDANLKNTFRNITYIQGDATNTGLESDYFSKVVVSHALQWMERSTRFEIYQEVKRILAEDGQFIILEEDDPKNLFLRFFIFIWFWDWLPSFLIALLRSRDDIYCRSISLEVKEAGFRNIRKIPAYKGTMQTVICEK